MERLLGGGLEDRVQGRHCAVGAHHGEPLHRLLPDAQIRIVPGGVDEDVLPSLDPFLGHDHQRTPAEPHPARVLVGQHVAENRHGALGVHLHQGVQGLHPHVVLFTLVADTPVANTPVANTTPLTALFRSLAVRGLQLGGSLGHRRRGFRIPQLGELPLNPGVQRGVFGVPGIGELSPVLLQHVQRRVV